MSRRALVLAAHGSHVSPTSSDAAREHVAALRRRAAFDQVEAVFWKEFPSLRDARYLIDAETVVVVPLFMADGYFADRVVPRELELNGPVTERDGQRWHYTPPVGTDPRLLEVIVHRAEQAVAGARPLTELALLVIGHGTVQNRRSKETVLEHAGRLRESGRFAAVGAAFLDDAPTVADALAETPGNGLVAVPLFVAEGRHTERDLPRALGLALLDGRWQVPCEVGGRTIWYTAPVGTDPVLVDVILHRAEEALDGAGQA